MTFDTNLDAIEQVEIPELYALGYGGVFEYYTSFEKDLTFNSNLYLAAPIKRSGFSANVNMGSVKVTLAAPLLPAFVRYIANQPMEPTHVIIYRALGTDLTDYVTLFEGDVQVVSLKDRVARASCEAKSAILTTMFPRIVFQSTCNWQLFDADCALSDAAFLVQTAVTVSGSDLTAAVFATFSDGYFTGGRALIENDERMIIKHVGNTITLHVPFDDRVETGTTIKCYPGCDGLHDTCENTFSNTIAFLAMPYIPSTNPVMWALK